MVMAEEAITVAGAALYNPRRRPEEVKMSMPPTPCVMALALGLAASTPEGASTTATRRVPQFENESVRVWRSTIVPGQPLSLHRHESGRVIVALQGGTLKVVKESGESRSVTWETGNAYWLPADPPGERHADVNEGKDPIVVMVVELAPRDPQASR
jgi:quercetin dioxygenase-like cupin family protein